MRVRKPTLAHVTVAGALLAGGVGLAACGGGSGSGASGAGLSGNIVIDGSSTVAPLSTAAAEGFNAANAGVDVEVRTSGTGAGFEVFCKGETDISDASRPIKDSEAAKCAAANIGYTELRVASDGITLVTKKGVDVGKPCLTLGELKRIWGPASKVANWKDVGAGFKDLPMKLAGAGSQSGTYDFFNEVVLGKDAAGKVVASRQDYAASEDDNVTVNVVEAERAALGYFGFSYYEENIDRLADFALDSGKGCVKPAAATITDGSYPLARPLFIYVKNTSLERAEVRAFARYYLENATSLATDQKFVPAPKGALTAALAKVPAA